MQYFWREVRAATRTELGAGRGRAVGACCAAIGVFGAALAVIHTFFPSLFAISRITLEPTIGAYGAATDAIGISRLHGQLLALAPNLAGVAAAVMGSLHAALVTTEAVAAADRAPEGNGAVPGGVPASLLNGMVVLSVVLVASVLLVTLHVHAHGPLYGAGASAQAEFAKLRFHRLGHRAQHHRGVDLRAASRSAQVCRPFRDYRCRGHGSRGCAARSLPASEG